MTLLRSLIFNIYFYLLFTIMALLGLPLLALPRRKTYDYGRLWTRLVLFGLKTICGLDYGIRDLQNLPQGPCLIACKHQSAWETLVLPMLVLYGPSCVLKKELLNLPFFGWYLRHTQHIPIDRSGGAKALKEMIAKAKKAAADRRAIVIFPEGTRTEPGEKVDYHVGVAALYKALALPVVPVALNSGHFWGPQAFLKYPGEITLQFLPPIAPGLPREDFMTKLQDTIEAASDKLAQEAEASRTG